MSHPSKSETDFWSLWVHYRPNRWHILQNVPSFMGWDRLLITVSPLQTEQMTHTTECPILHGVRQTFDHCEPITALTDDTYYRMSHPSWGETDSLAYCDSITDLTDDTSYRMSHPSKSETDCFGHLFHYKQMTLPAECPILQGVRQTVLVTDSIINRWHFLQNTHPSRSETDCVGHWFHYRQTDDTSCRMPHPSRMWTHRLCGGVITMCPRLLVSGSGLF